MVNLRSLQQLNKSVTRMIGIIDGGNTSQDPDVADICCPVIGDLQRMQEELKPMINDLDSYEERMIMTLRFLKGIDYSSIAEKMNVTDRTVYNYLRKAKQHLFMKYPDRIIL